MRARREPPPPVVEAKPPVLLTSLSVLAGWSLLGTLVAGLFAILTSLQRVRRSVEQITMGVRAIETETAPLGGHIHTLVGALDALGGPLVASVGHLTEAGGDLDAAVPALHLPVAPPE